MAAPLPFRWSGEALEILPRFAKQADREFVIGQVYRMADVEERSTATHNHEFAWLKEAWQSLPESVGELYPSAEHLRKRALIEAGYYDEMIVDAGTNAAAIRVAAAFRKHDDFAHAVVRGPIVAVRTAKSQSRRAMDKATFQASKTAIMEVIAAMIGVAPDELRRAA